MQYQHSVPLKPSRWRLLCYALVALVLLLSQISLVARLGNWVLPASLIIFYLLAQHWQKPLSLSMLFIGKQGQLRWLDDCLPAGQILPNSVSCQFGVWLYWRDASQQVHQQWLFADNFNEADFRALARIVQQQHWLAAS